MKRPIGNLQKELISKVLNEQKKYLETIDLDLYGEFELNPQWFSLIKQISSAGFFTVLNTNASLLNKDNAEKLTKSGLNFLSVSFDGASKETYEKIRRGAQFERTRENILHFLSINSSIFTVIQMVETTENRHETDEFYKLWADSKADVIRIKNYLPFDPDASHLNPNPIIMADNPPPCIFPWKTLVVYWDGTVVPCCVDYDGKYVLGNALKQSIEEIWNGKPMQHLREMHAKGCYKKIDLCRRCNPMTPSPLALFAGSFVDDPMRRKILPYFEEIERKKGWSLFRK